MQRKTVNIPVELEYSEHGNRAVIRMTIKYQGEYLTNVLVASGARQDIKDLFESKIDIKELLARQRDPRRTMSYDQFKMLIVD